MIDLKFVSDKIHDIQLKNNDNWEETARDLREIEKDLVAVLDYVKDCRKIYESYTEEELKNLFDEVIK